MTGSFGPKNANVYTNSRCPRPLPPATPWLAEHRAAALPPIPLALGATHPQKALYAARVSSCPVCTHRPDWPLAQSIAPPRPRLSHLTSRGTTRPTLHRHPHGATAGHSEQPARTGEKVRAGASAVIPSPSTAAAESPLRRHRSAAPLPRQPTQVPPRLQDTLISTVCSVGTLGNTGGLVHSGRGSAS